MLNKISKSLLLLMMPFILAAQSKSDSIKVILSDSAGSQINGYFQKSMAVMPINNRSVRGSYPLEVSFQKTSHLIFPNKIVYVDVGSDFVIADKSEPTQNVLRIKADKKGFEETSLTIITENGMFYSFLVNYADNPEKLNISIGNNLQTDEIFSETTGFKKTTPENIILPENTMNESDLEQFSWKIYELKRFIKSVGVSKLRMSMILSGVYVKDNVLFLQFQIENNGEIDYRIDFMKFYLHDLDVVKRMAYQEIEIKPLYEYNKNITEIPKQKTISRVIALPLFTFPDNKIMSVEIYEKSGGRHLKVEIDNETIVSAKSL
jgi:conjugative transposon TraN protein